MTLPKDVVKPKYNFTYPSERPYYDETFSALGSQVVTDTSKSGSDYGIQNPKMTEAIGASGSETGNGGSAP